MKANNTIKRLSTLILIGSITVLAASADNVTTSATNKPAAKHRLPVSNVSTTRKSAPLATSSRATASANSEPDRIYDLGSRNFISNPDYHEPPRPAPAKRSGQRMEPRRIFNALTGNFEINPDYREPAGAMAGTRRPNRATEPARIFNPETGNFEPNPAFGTPQ
jgi:hypothetical protein